MGAITRVVTSGTFSLDGGTWDVDNNIWLVGEYEEPILWRRNRDLVLTAGGIEVHALHTPGHSPGSVCWSAPALNAVISGDTLFQGGPGATGRSYSSFPTILESISTKLGTLPDETVVYTGHGDTTTIGGELVHYDEWVKRGH